MIFNPETRSFLIKKAEEMTQRSYAPYSKFHVGCAVLSKEGNVYTGCNVENASYGLALCSERTAIFSGVSTEGKGFEIAALAVATNPTIDPASPCGACRQVMSEFGKDFPIIFFKDGSYKDFSLQELLPFRFSF